MKRELQSSSHCRHLVMYHLIFCAKYRRKIFANKDFGEAMKNELVAISKKYDFSIDTIDLDYAKHDRDINAALNILYKGNVLAQSIVGGEQAESTNACGGPKGSMKQEVSGSSLLKEDQTQKIIRL